MIQPVLFTALALSVTATPVPESEAPRCKANPKNHLDWFNRSSDGKLWGTDDGSTSCRYFNCANPNKLIQRESLGKDSYEMAWEETSSGVYPCIVAPRCQTSPKNHLNWFNRSPDGAMWGTDDGASNCQYFYCADSASLSGHESIGKDGLEMAWENTNSGNYPCIVAPRCKKSPTEHLDWLKRFDNGVMWGTDDGSNSCQYQYCTSSYERKSIEKDELQEGWEFIKDEKYSCIFYPPCINYNPNQELFAIDDQRGWWFSRFENGAICTIRWCDNDDTYDGNSWGLWSDFRGYIRSYKWSNKRNRICLQA